VIATSSEPDLLPYFDSALPLLEVSCRGPLHLAADVLTIKLGAVEGLHTASPCSLAILTTSALGSLND
jgi:hypothetical protein